MSQRYTQYTHKISVPMRKELHDFYAQFPHGIKAQIARMALLKFMSILENVPESEQKAYLYDLVNGQYRISTDTHTNNLR